MGKACHRGSISVTELSRRGNADHEKAMWGNPAGQACAPGQHRASASRTQRHHTNRLNRLAGSAAKPVRKEPDPVFKVRSAGETKWLARPALTPVREAS